MITTPRRKLGRTGLRGLVATAVVATIALAGAAATSARPHTAGTARRLAPGAGHTVVVDPATGVVGTTFTASGGGCDAGIVTYRIDGGSQNIPIAAQADGSWSVTIAFPSPRGLHQLTFACSDPSTSGAPTTIFGPGTLRFDYDPVTVTTAPSPEPPPSVAPSVPAPVPCGTSTVTTIPDCTPPAPAPPATPVPGHPLFTG